MSNRQSVQATASLNEANHAKLERFAELRGESVQQTLDALLALAVKRIPGSLRASDAPLTDFPVADAGVEQGYPWIKLDNERVFYAPPTKLRYANLYHLMRDKTPAVLSPETFQSAIDARRLYWQAANHSTFPPPGSTVVDAGAYVGYKAIGFADAVGPHGAVVAIELDPENFDLLSRNIDANGLRARIAAHNCGVWSSAGELPFSGTGHMQHTLTPLDHQTYPERGTAVVRPLDDILDDSKVDRVDFLNIQVNGAEVEVLQGLQRWWERTGVVRVAAYYTRDGEPTAPEVRRLLDARGARLLNASPEGNITAAGPATRHL